MADKIILRGDNKWAVWLKKWIPAVVTPTIATGIVATANYLEINPLPITPQYAFVSGLIVTILYQIGNLIKHA